MKKKSIQSVLIYVIFCCLIVLLSSCHKDDNPVNPTPPPPPPPPILDTADRYIWTAHYPALYSTYVYAADTDRIFIIGEGQLQLYNGVYIGSYHLNDQNFYAENVYGYDKDNIFILGSYWKNGDRYPELKKMTNGSITSYYWTDKGIILYNMLVTGPNQVWITASFISKVYYFDNGVISEYTVNSTDSLLYEFLYKGKDNSLYVFAVKSSNEVNGYFYTYKFVNDHFELLNIEYFNDKFPFLYRCGPDIIKSPYLAGDLKYFDGNGWVNHSNYDSLHMEFAIKFGGISKDSLVLFDNNGEIKTFGYAGWRKEKFKWFHPTSGLKDNIETKFGNVYFTVWNNGGTLIIGKAKKNTKN